MFSVSATTCHFSNLLRHFPMILLSACVLVTLLWLRTRGFGFPEFHVVGSGGTTTFNFDTEDAEQAYLWSHLLATDNVLSVGGNIGRTCIFIDKLVENPSKSMCVEPNPATRKFLEENKRVHGAHFQIYPNILSRPGGGVINFTAQGIGSHISQPGEPISFQVPTFDHDLSGYNVLVSDCEGCFCELFREFPELLRYRLVINEYDARCEYNFHDFMLKNGFARVDGSLQFLDLRPPHDVYAKRHGLSLQPVYSHLMQLSFTLRRKLGYQFGLKPPLLLGEICVTLLLTSIFYFASGLVFFVCTHSTWTNAIKGYLPVATVSALQTNRKQGTE